MTREEFEELLGGGFKPTNNERVSPDTQCMTRTFAGKTCYKRWPMTEWIMADTWRELAKKMGVKNGTTNE